MHWLTWTNNEQYVFFFAAFIKKFNRSLFVRVNYWNIFVSVTSFMASLIIDSELIILIMLCL